MLLNKAADRTLLHSLPKNHTYSSYLML